MEEDNVEHKKEEDTHINPLWQDRLLVLLTHKKALANEILMGSEQPAELSECYKQLNTAFDEVINAEIKFQASF